MTYVPRTIGVPWFRQADFETIKGLPGSDLHGTFDEWEARAARMFDILQLAGQPLARVYVGAQELIDFADSISATAISASVRAELANKKLADSEVRPLAAVTVQCPQCSEVYVYPAGVLDLVGQLRITCRCGERIVSTNSSQLSARRANSENGL